MSNELKGNPYVVGPPVAGENLFGRQEVFQFIQESLTGLANRVIVLHGQRRVGKSSILQELHLHRLPSEQYCAVRIDVQGQAQTPFSSTVHDLAAHIAEVLDIREPDLTDYQENADHFIKTFLPEALAALGERRLIIMIDEFDALAPNEDDSSPPSATSSGLRFLPMLQTILDDSDFDKIIFVLVIGRSLEKLPPTLNHLIRGARFSRIWLLSREDAETLITEPVADLLTYDKEAIDRILYYTSGHPYFTQLLCYEVFNRAKRRQQSLVRANDVNQIINIALETGGPAFVWLWDALTIAERLFVSAIASVSLETGAAHKEDIQETLNQNRIRLGNVDLIEAGNHLVRERVLQYAGEDDYQFEVELVRQWIKKNHNLNQERLKISEMSRAAVSAYNVARRTHDRGKIDAAIEGYRLALQDNPNHFNAQLGLAKALWDSGNLEQAVEEYEDAYWLNEEASRDGLIGVRMALAKQLEEQGQHVEAAVHYRRVRELASDYRQLQENLRVYYDKGNQARNRGNSTEAAEFFERVTDIDPNYKDAHTQLLDILYTQGREAEKVEDWYNAAHLFERVVDIDSNYKDVHDRRDHAYRQLEATATAKKSQATPERSVPPAAKRSLASIIGMTAIILIFFGGISIGGWLIWSGGFSQTTPTPTQAIVSNTTPTTSPTTEPTEEPTVEPTQELIIEPTEEPTIEVTEEPTTGPTTETTSEPTEEPTQESAEEITEEPTTEPTTETTSEPTEEPTTEPTPTEEPTEQPAVTPALEPNPLPAVEALDIDVDPQDSATLFALLKNGAIYRTPDGGNAWEEVHATNPLGFSVLTIAPNNSAIIYVGGFGQILKSTDGGDEWSALSPTVFDQIQIHDLAVAGTNQNVIYAATSGGIFISQDGGSNWTIARNTANRDLITPFYTIGVAAGRDSPVYAAGEGDVIYRTDDPSANWQAMVCSGCANPFFALAVQGDTIYAGGAGARIYRSDNGGNDWQPAYTGISTSIPTLDISTIVLSPEGNTIFAGTGFRGTNDNGQGVFKSEDGGMSWSQLPLPNEAGRTYYVQNIAIDPQNPSTIYIAGFGGVHKSKEGGQTWVKQ